MTKSSEYELGSTNLFKPIKVGNVVLQNRTYFAPTTRRRGTIDAVPSDLIFDHYAARSKNNGGLIVTEATFISPNAAGSARVPGIWTDQQLQAWKKIVTEVHKNGTFISLQMWNLGRAADPEELNRWGVPFVSSSDIYIDETSKKLAEQLHNPLRLVTLLEIENFKNQYIHAAKNAIDVAGFDFVELHNAHGYFLDQFLQPSINQRTDKYGGSIENRARLVLEIIDLLISEIGAEKIGIRLSPWAQFSGCLGENEVISPIAYQGYLLSELNRRKIAYVSIVEPRVPSGRDDVKELKGILLNKSNDFVYQIFSGPVLRAGNYLNNVENNFKDLREQVNANDRTLIGFSRHYTSNPDLVHRLKYGLKLTHYDRSHFYTEDNYHYNTWGKADEAEIADEIFAKRKPVAL